MQDHAFIGKFMGIWPMEKALNWWIKTTWKPKGQIDLKLGSKGFFTTIFSNLEDHDKVFKGGPYFFNSAGLHFRPWTERFSPEKEDFMVAPVWIRLYSLPHEFWDEEILEGIGNTIGSFVKSSEGHQNGTLYLVCMNLCIYGSYQIPP
jgi:hypothetical protein